MLIDVSCSAPEGLSSSRSGTSQSSLSQGAISRENMAPMKKRAPKLKPPAPTFNHASSSASSSTRSSLDRVCGQLPTDTREPTEEADKKLEAMMEKLASSEKEFFPQLTQLRNAHREAKQLLGEFNKLSTEERGLMQELSLIQQSKKNFELIIALTHDILDSLMFNDIRLLSNRMSLLMSDFQRELTEEADKKLEATMEKIASSIATMEKFASSEEEFLRREQQIGEFNKLSSEERGLMQKLSLIQQNKKNVELSIDSLQDEVAERRSLLERNDVRQQLDGFRNLSISRLKQSSTKVKKIETERKKFVGLSDLEKARKIKLEEEVHVLEQQGDGDKVLCQICMVNKKNTLVLPCMHFLFCHNCLVIHQTNNNTCPACRGFVTAFLHCKLEMD